MTGQPLWRLRNFRLLFASTAMTNLGDGVMAVAIPWLATRLTQDPVLIGLVPGRGRCRGSCCRCPRAC